MLPQMMLTTPGAMNIQGKYTLVPNLMALVKTMVGMIGLPKGIIERNHQETGLSMAA